MPKVHPGSAVNYYTITYVHPPFNKELTRSGWHARNSVDATESFERANPGAKVVRIEREVVSHLA